MRSLPLLAALLLATPALAAPNASLHRWAAEATSFDCPLTPDEARHLADDADALHRRLAQAIGCACDVVVSGGLISRKTDCGLAGAISEFQSALQQDQRSAMLARGRAAAAANRGGHVTVKVEVGAGDQAALAWAHRLEAKKTAPVEAITRRQPLDAGRDAKALVGKEESESKSFQQVRVDHDKVAGDARQRSWQQADFYLKALKEDVAFHERTTMNGKRSEAARALLADAETLMKGGQKQLAAHRRMEKDPSFKKLDDALGRVSAEADAYAKLWGRSVAVGCSTQGGKACEIQKRQSKIEAQLDALGARYGVERD